MDALVLTLIVTLSAFTGIWLIQVRLRDAGVIDFYWAPGFFVILLITGAFTGFNAAILTIGALIGLWSWRLTSHLVERHGKAIAEDGRYAAMRTAGGDAFWWTSLFRIFLLQGLLQWMIATPIHILPRYGGSVKIAAALIAGMILYAIGMVIEAVADRQLRRFKTQTLPQESLLTNGLFSICRHPNYLGEMILWVGIAMVAFGFTGSPWAFAGPALLITLMILVSIPLTEQHLRLSRPSFEAWATRTPMLVPRFTSLRSLQRFECK